MLGFVLAIARIALVGGAIEVSGLDARDLARGDLEKLLQVSVYDSDRPDAEPPPVLGSYEIDGRVLLFRPMFPFTPGLTYRATMETTGDRVQVELLTAPVRNESPTTTVVAFYPTADVLPENQLKLYLHFSAPMSGGDGLRYARLYDSSGNEVVDPFLPLGEHFWDRERRRYTIFFDPGRVKRGILPNEELGRPLIAGERYRLVIDPGWPDGNRLALADAFEKSFTASGPDEEPLDPERWKLSSPRPGTRESLVVDFGEPLDREILRHALFVENSAKHEVEGTVNVSHAESVWSFTPSKAWEVGVHDLVALGILEDLAGNRIGRAFEVDVFEQIDSPEEGEEKEVYRVRFVINDGAR